jgi:predicted nucleic acid-binding protein
MRLFLDSAPIIYVVEGVPSFDKAVERHFAQPDVEILACELSRLECLVKPLRDGNRDLVEDFEEFFTAAITHWIPISRKVLEVAATLRARQPSLRTPDAIQLAAALEAHCDVFLTNDHRLASPSDKLHLEVLTPS